MALYNEEVPIPPLSAFRWDPATKNLTQDGKRRPALPPNYEPLNVPKHTASEFVNAGEPHPVNTTLVDPWHPIDPEAPTLSEVWCKLGQVVMNQPNVTYHGEPWKYAAGECHEVLPDNSVVVHKSKGCMIGQTLAALGVDVEALDREGIRGIQVLCNRGIIQPGPYGEYFLNRLIRFEALQYYEDEPAEIMVEVDIACSVEERMNDLGFLVEREPDKPADKPETPTEAEPESKAQTDTEAK